MPTSPRRDRSAWPLDAARVSEALSAVQRAGLRASVYGKDLSSWERLLFGPARRALPANERDYLPALEAFATDKPWWACKQTN